MQEQQLQSRQMQHDERQDVRHAASDKTDMTQIVYVENVIFLKITFST